MTLDAEVASRVVAELTAAGEPFEVIDEVVHGRTIPVWRNAPRTLRDILSTSSLFGDLEYLVHGKERWSYYRHACTAASLARYLVSEMGVQRGDRIAIASSNRIPWSIAFWGATAAGAVVVPLNSWGVGEELEYAIRDSGASVLFVDSARLVRLAGRLDGVHVVTLDGPADAHASGSASVREWTDMVDPYAEFELPDVAVDTDDDATIFYTSGTTGRPKGAVGTHRNMTTNVMNLLYWGTEAARIAEASGEVLPDAHPPAQESTLVTVPLFHATGCHATLVATAAMGGKLLLLNKFEPDVAVDLIERERITRIMGVPTTIQALTEAGEGRDLTSITYIGYGGAPAPPSLITRIRAAMPNASFGVGYGLTESSANATTNIGGAYEDNPTSVGRTCPVVRVSVIGETGQLLPIGEVGEVVLSGPNIVRGYWNRPDDTAEAFVDGALRTGDLGYLDEQGNLYICDRSKDIVIRGGENVYCAEIEHILCEDPQIAEAAVIGRPHATLGEEVVAVVRLAAAVSPDHFDSLSVQDSVGRRLAAFKVPTAIEIHQDHLPRTATGKIRKDVLRETFATPDTAPSSTTKQK